jgi:retinol-binding protein 3
MRNSKRVTSLPINHAGPFIEVGHRPLGARPGVTMDRHAAPVAVVALLLFAPALPALSQQASAVPAPARVGAQAPARSAVPMPQALTSAERREVAATLAAALDKGYAHADLGQKMARAVRARLLSGAYDRSSSAAEFARVLTADVRAVKNDKHLRVTFGRGIHPVPLPGTASPRLISNVMKGLNGGISRVEILEGNIGYMEVSGFPPLDEAKRAIASAFAFLHETDALIIDARANGGGDPETVAFYVGYLTDRPSFVVNLFHWRSGDKVTATRTTALGSLSYGEAKPVFYLTSRRTFSGGEELAYDLEALRRARIIGQRTGGGANPGDLSELGHGFFVFLPNGYVTNPITHSNWEGVGVPPDIQVSADEALCTAELSALERLRAAAEPAGASALALLTTLIRRDPRVCNPAGQPVPNHLPASQVVGQYLLGAAVGATVYRAQQSLYLALSTPNTPAMRLIPRGGDRYLLDGYPQDNSASFFPAPNGGVRLVVYLAHWPAAIMVRNAHGAI